MGERGCRQASRWDATASPLRPSPPPAADVGDVHRFSQLWTPEAHLPDVQASSGAPAVAASTGYDDHKPRTPPPDLPSLLLDSRIVYLGMPVRRRSGVGGDGRGGGTSATRARAGRASLAPAPDPPSPQLVPAVTELIIAEMLYLQYKDRNKVRTRSTTTTTTTTSVGGAGVGRALRAGRARVGRGG